MKLAVYIHVGLRTRQIATVKKTVLHITLQNEIKVTLYRLHIVCSKAQESCVLHCLAGVLIKVNFKRILCDHYPKGQKSYNYLS